MATNKSKANKLHELLPSHLNSKNNINWSALINAIGERDQETADLIEEVRKQFFTKTASRPYLDKLAANNKIARPKLVGMDDQSFKQYIPVLSYQPKQVKLIIDKLLDVFFFKESTTAFITSNNGSPFYLESGWELDLKIDEEHSERISFSEEDFIDISSATADEIIASINRQTKYCYATSYYESISKNTYIRLFTNTIGAKGSLRVIGGRSNVSFKFDGFIENAGQGSDTVWQVTKIGDETTFQHVGGTSPGLSDVQIGDIVIINLENNEGSFSISDIDVYSNKIIFKNLFSTIGIFTQTNDSQVKFIRPNKYTAYLNSKRAITWETTPGEIIIEMPTSPPVVKRSLKGSGHINGAVSLMTNRNSDTSLTVEDAFQFPESGKFFLERVNEIITKIETTSLSETISYRQNSRLEYPIQVYEYSDRTVLETTCSFTSNSNTLFDLLNTTGLEIGQQVSVDGVPAYAKIIGIYGSTVTISAYTEKENYNASVKFLGNTLNGISPTIPVISSLNEYDLSSLVLSSNEIECTTITSHNYKINENVIISDCEGIALSIVGTYTDGSNIISNISDMSWIDIGTMLYSDAFSSHVKVIYVGLDYVVVDQYADFSLLSLTIEEIPLIDDVEDIDSLYVSSIERDTDIFVQINGTYKITDIGTNTFKFKFNGPDGSSSIPGKSRVERIGLSNYGSKIIISSAISEKVSRIKGPYIWDERAPYVLSSNTANIIDSVKAGKIVRLINLTANNMSNDGGYVIFDYGLSTQEGPVRYLYKPTSSTMAIDPSYTFIHNHDSGSFITEISKRGPHQISTNGAEYALYVTNPSDARFILQDLIKSIKSAGIFVNFLVRYPEQLYATLDVYESGKDPG